MTKLHLIPGVTHQMTSEPPRTFGSRGRAKESASYSLNDYSHYRLTVMHSIVPNPTSMFSNLQYNFMFSVLFVYAYRADVVTGHSHAYPSPKYVRFCQNHSQFRMVAEVGSA
jgi:hypothetical protein